MARSLSPIGVQQDLSGRIFDIQSYSVHDGPGCLVRWYFYQDVRCAANGVRIRKV